VHPNGRVFTFLGLKISELILDVLEGRSIMKAGLPGQNYVDQGELSRTSEGLRRGLTAKSTERLLCQQRDQRDATIFECCYRNARPKPPSLRGQYSWPRPRP
jgi:hypothetical protein